MGKGRKPATPWLIFVQGILLALGIYLLEQLLVALLLVRGTLPEQSVFPVVAVTCLLAALAGGISCVRRSAWGRLPSGLLAAGGFAAVLIAVGLLSWEGITWTGHGGILLLCALAGGLLAGVLGGRQGRRVKRKRR